MKRAKTKSIMIDTQNIPKVEITYLGRDVMAAIANIYGIHSSPKKDTECIVGFINGDDGNRFIIPLSNKKRKKLKETEVIVGNFEKKSTIFFDEKGNITLDCAKDITLTIKGNATINVTGNTNLTCPIVNVNGKIEQSGDYQTSGKIDANGKITSSGQVEGASLKAGNGANIVKPTPPSSITVVNGIVTAIT